MSEPTISNKHFSYQMRGNDDWKQRRLSALSPALPGIACPTTSLRKAVRFQLRGLKTKLADSVVSKVTFGVIKFLPKLFSTTAWKT